MSSTITIRVEENVKKEANNIFKEVGMLIFGDQTGDQNILLK